MNFAAILPLGGGMPIGTSQVLEKQPEFAVSWNKFWGNDKHYYNYLQEHDWKGKWYNLEDENDKFLFDNTEYNIDMVCAVPVCAGLSALSSTSCATNNANQVMYDCAEVAMGKIKPKIYFFENAPALATDKGKPVAEKLYEIADKFGYNMLLLQTASKYEGNPQKRPRTWAFFFKRSYFENKTLLFPDYVPNHCGFYDFMKKQVKPDNDSMDVLINTNTPSEDPWYKCSRELMRKRIGKPISDDYHEFLEAIGEYNQIDLMAICLWPMENLEFSIEYFRENHYEKHLKKAEYAKYKYSIGKTVFTHGMIASLDEISGLISVSSQSIMHPIEDRYLTLREAAQIMGMPNDWHLIDNKEIHVLYQNVSPGLSNIFTNQIIKWIAGKNEARYTYAPYVVQTRWNNRIQERIKEPENNINIDELFS